MPQLANEFLRDLLLELPNAEEAVLRRELFRVLNEACVKGWAYPVVHGPLDILLANNGEIDLGAEFPQFNIGVPLQVFFKGATGWGRGLHPLTTEPLASDLTSSEPHSYWLKEPNVLNIFPYPTVDQLQTLTLRLALTPDIFSVDVETTLTLPDYFWTHHRDMLIDGVCHRMMRQAGKPWSNRTESKLRGTEYRAGLAQARDYARHTWGFGDTTWAYPEFAHGGPFNAVPSDARISPL